jgi:hypothetical protein
MFIVRLDKLSQESIQLRTCQCFDQELIIVSKEKEASALPFSLFDSFNVCPV